jgi:oligopeptide transport system permease protein
MTTSFVPDFSPAEHQLGVEQLSRPSLSYWQDAWIRLKQNTRAIISLYIVIALALFTLIGPYLWQVDPALQDLNQISQAPSMPKPAILAAPYERWQPIVLDDFPAEPDTYLDVIPAPDGLAPVGTPTTQRIRLTWNPVEGAGGYSIYRNQHAPEGLNDLGLPLATTYGGNEVSYEDRLNLEARDYYYSIVPTDGLDESDTYTSIKITPTIAITRDDAIERDIRSARQYHCGFIPWGLTTWAGICLPD